MMLNETLDATHHDGHTDIRRGELALRAGCGPGEFNASALLLAALAACVGATLEPLLARHGITERLGIVIDAGTAIRATVTLPQAARPLLTRCERAARRCPVVSALADPVAFEWKFED